MTSVTFRRALLALCILGLASFAGCKDDTPSRPDRTACTFDSDCDTGSCIDGYCEDDLSDVVEDGDTDDEDGETDTDPGDGESDTEETETVDPCTQSSDRPFECECEEDSDCASGRCFRTLDGNVCSKQCSTDADCGSSGQYQCIVPNDSGGDTINLCVPVLAELCTRCADQSECSSNSTCYGFSDDSNCLIACDDEDDCPSDFSCQDVGDGAQNYCFPDLQTCSGCYDPDRDSAGEGPECAATDCNQENPNVFSGADELCDGLDNDCNDVVDDPFVDEEGDYTFDEDHCGGCNISCEDQSVNPNVTDGFCDEGTCGVNECDAGFLDCTAEPGCETSTSNPNNCGTCGNDCVALSASEATNYTCSEIEEGTFDCVPSSCEFGFADCDGDDICEADLSTDNTCGTCSTDCDTLANTDDGMCNVTGSGATTSYDCSVDQCTEGFCDHDPASPGCEDPLTNDRFCGSTDCSTPVNCTDANVVRNASGRYCNEGLCDYETCSSGYADCDGDPTNGCESDTRDPSTCTDGCFDCNTLVSDPSANVTGLAGAQCSSSNGCLFNCQAGFGNCDNDFTNGCEQPLNTLTTCGSCGNDCSRRFANSSGSCGGSPPLNQVDPATGCGLGECDEGYVDLDGVVTTGCECSQGTTDQPDFDGEAGSGTDTNCDSVDGDAINSVFVSTSGADDATCGVWGDLDGDGNTEIPTTSSGDLYDFGDESFNRSQLAAPHACRSITQGIQRARDLGLEQVLISSGTYSQPSGGLVVDGGIQLYGGYSTDFKSRSENSKSIVNTSSARRLVRVLNVADEQVVFSGMELRGLDLDPAAKSASSGAGKGSSVYTMWIESSTNVTVVNSRVIGGTGEGGENGQDGSSGQSGETGLTGGGGEAVNAACGPNVTGGSGGSGGNLTCDGINVSGGTGGDGAGSNGDDRSGETGDDGQINPSSGGAGGGSGSNGDSGDPGEGGANGSAGNAPTNPAGVFSGGELVAADGSDGSDGEPGEGGGGGGGGGSQGTRILGCGAAASGGGGGGGGSGGCAGDAGERGYAGGGAAAVVLISSDADFIDSTIQLGVGGAGGAGGDGGDGGSGGPAGSKGSGSGGGINEDGGAGGDGGIGGPGGGAGGGAGACGGASIGIAVVSGSSYDSTDIQFAGCGASNCGGAGGPGGSGGRRGGGTGAQADSGDDGCRGAQENELGY